jgi:uridine phosphorylase
MGRHNAETALRSALAAEKPDLVLTCGFAGGLRSDLPSGTVLFSADNATGLPAPLTAAGAIPAKFHCAASVATTTHEKMALRQTTLADAVEMESGVIAALCQERGIPCATVRVVLDAADDDLPLDFNQLMNERMEMDFVKLAWALAKSPGTIPSLLHLRAQTRAAAGQLGGVLTRLLVPSNPAAPVA